MRTILTERLVCSADHPFQAVGSPRGARWEHPDAEEVGDQEDGYPAGDIVTYQCPHCGLRFRRELPQ
jgi:hypothetical protein